MKFTKMHGAGNDYIYINCFEEDIVPEEMIDDIIAMSDRHKGIGSDGVIFIMPSKCVCLMLMAQKVRCAAMG